MAKMDSAAALAASDLFADRPMYFQHCCTHNDRNGNPRRLFVLVQDGRRVAAWDEGYRGYHCVPSHFWPMAREAERVDIRPGLYLELKRTMGQPC